MAHLCTPLNLCLYPFGAAPRRAEAAVGLKAVPVATSGVRRTFRPFGIRERRRAAELLESR